MASAAAVILLVRPAPAEPPPAGRLGGVEIRVGIAEGDIRGSDQRALQAAVDHVAALGGGTVHMGPGRYQMRNALTLRNHVHVVGEPGKTVLVACTAPPVRLAADGDCYERQITLTDAAAFQVGDGVLIRDRHYAAGFEMTTATLTARLDARTFRLSTPLYLDYMVHHQATAARAFPVVGGWNIHDVVVEGLTVDGQRGPIERMDGCRGGGIYLFECRDVTLRNCLVRDYNGDGISFQVSDRVTVEDCRCEGNSGLGLHPGSGSQHPVLRRNHALHNGEDGLYVCWRVKHGLFEDNEIRDNHGVGISIGHKDTDNLFRHNTITGNGQAGVLFRAESEPMGAHRNVFEGNRILDNGPAEGSQRVGVVIRGCHHDVVFRQNTIGSSKPTPAGIGIVCGGQAADLRCMDNHFVHVTTAIRGKAR